MCIIVSVNGKKKKKKICATGYTEWKRQNGNYDIVRILSSHSRGKNTSYTFYSEGQTEQTYAIL